MPSRVEQTLQRKAEQKFPGDKQRQNRYVYGTMRKMGWVPKVRSGSASPPPSSSEQKTQGEVPS